MGIVDDLFRMQSVMAADRYGWESAWRDVVNTCMPYASHLYDFAGGSVSQSLSGIAQQPESVRRSRETYDATASWGLERLTAGMEGMVSPRSQKWHSFSLDDAFAPEPTDLEEEWLDHLRDYHFAARYDAKSNFALANQKAIRSACGLGTGITYLEENLGRRGVDPVKVPFFYRSIPLAGAYLGIDAYDDVDKVIQITDMSGRAAVAYFGSDNVSDAIRKSAEKEPDRLHTFLHAVLPREEAGEHKDKRRNMPFASFWCEAETRHLIRSSGFFTFPFSVMWWDQTDGSAYGQSPVMACMSEIKMLQVMGKSVAQAAQQMIKPPMATMPGIYNQRLNLNSGAVNPGYLDENGRLKAQPIITAQNLTFAERLMEAKRAGVSESLFVNLFQILVSNPQMTATEAIIRANEKGEMLGPAGAKIETGVARSIDREVDIVARKGAFAPGSPLEPPSTMDGKNIGVKFTGPLARLRRMQEMQGVEAVTSLAQVFAQVDPTALDRIDTDETLEIAREIRGAPRKMFKTDAEVAEIRQRRAQQAEQQAQMQLAQGMAQTAKDATPAMQALAQANGVAA